MNAGAARKGSEGSGGFLPAQMRPRGRLLTPFNLVTAPVILLGAAIVVTRFVLGLGAVTNLSQEFPWGLWKGFNVITGVAFAGGAYVLTFMVHILGLDRYRSLVRVTVLNGFLAYLFVGAALALDLGRPWNIFNPFIGKSFGVSSVLFLVAWHFLLYMIAELIEFSPAVAEWLGWTRLRRIALSVTTATVILGTTLSVLHQSGLGAIFLMARSKIHPLWYSEFMPVNFLVSSIFAGLSLVIIEGTVSRRVFMDATSRRDSKAHDAMLLGLGKVAAAALLVYLFLMILDLVHGRLAPLLATPMGRLYMAEIGGGVLLPLLLFIVAVRRGSMGLLRAGAVLAAVGVCVNRLNISMIAYNWNAPVHYVPTWMEIIVSLAVIFFELWVFRWIVWRMPVLAGSRVWARGEVKGEA